MKWRSGRAPPLCAPRIQARTRSFSPTKPLRFSVEQYEQGGSVSDWKSPGRAMSFRCADASAATSRNAADTTLASARARRIFILFILKTAVQTTEYAKYAKGKRKLSEQRRFSVA